MENKTDMKVQNVKCFDRVLEMVFAFHIYTRYTTLKFRNTGNVDNTNTEVFTLHGYVTSISLELQIITRDL